MVDRRKVSVGVDADVSPYVRGMATATAATKAFARELETADSKLSNAVQTGMALAPALVPVASLAVPAMAGLTTQLGAAAGAAGVALLAFNGVGDALGALNDYQLEPTAENLQKVQQEFEKIGPSGEAFVRQLDRLEPQLENLQDIAREGLFPGAAEGLQEMVTLMPEFRGIVSEIANTMGDLLADAGEGFTNDRWREFFDYIERTARPTLEDMGRTLGNVAEGMASLMVGMEPLSRDFSGFLLDMSDSFADWAAELSQTEGFAEFLAYLERVGPQVGETVGALANAFLQLAEAAAPVGEAILPVVETLANVLASVADSPVGPVLIGAAAGVSALSRSVALWNAANASAITGFMGRIGGEGGKAAAGARAAGAGLGVLGLAMTDLDDKAGLANTAMLGMAGALAGPWGAAAGASVGLLLDMAAANDAFNESADRADAILQSNTASMDMMNEAVRNAKDDLDALKGQFDSTLKAIFRPSSWKNSIEGLFGASDIEEAEQRYAELQEQLEDNTSTMGRYSRVQDMNNDGIRDSVDLLQQQIAAMEEFRTEALAASDGMIAYQQAVDDAAKAARENGKAQRDASGALDLNTQKGRENQAALNQVAASWNNLSGAQQNSQGAFKAARRNLIQTAQDLGMTKAAAREYANEVLEIPPARKTQIRLDGITQASQELSWLNEQLDWVARPRSARITIAQVYSQHGYQPLGGPQENAEGGTIAGDRYPYGDKVLSWLAPGEEVISNRHGQADRHRDLLKAINDNRFADGGTVGYSLDQRMELLRLQQQINQLRRDLAKDGEDSLKGLSRKIAEVELRSAQAGLRRARRAPVTDLRSGLGDARSGFEIDADMMPGEVRRELAEFRREIQQAGGTWTKAMDRNADRAVKHAQAINKAERAIERETNRREKLQDAIDAQMRSMEELQGIMHGFRDSVARPFMSDPFNLSIDAPVAARPTDPALIAARDQLGAAEARLRGIRGRGDIDPLQRSYLASRAVAEVVELRGQVDELERAQQSAGGFADETQRATTGLDAFRQAIEGNIEQAQRWDNLMGTLLDKGLDPQGGLFASLAPSADFATAEGLAALSPGQIDQYEALWERRDEVVTTMATRAMDAVYREESDRQVRELRALQAEARDTTREIRQQTNALERRTDRLENTMQRELQAVGRQVANATAAIGNVARQQETQRQKRGGKR